MGLCSSTPVVVEEAPRALVVAIEEMRTRKMHLDARAAALRLTAHEKDEELRALAVRRRNMGGTLVSGDETAARSRLLRRNKYERKAQAMQEAADVAEDEIHRLTDRHLLGGGGRTADALQRALDTARRRLAAAEQHAATEEGGTEDEAYASLVTTQLDDLLPAIPAHDPLVEAMHRAVAKSGGLKSEVVSTHRV